MLLPNSLCYNVPHKEPHDNFQGLQIKEKLGAPDELTYILLLYNED